MQLFATYDLPELGMRADARRQLYNPGQIVTYCFDESAGAARILIDPAAPDLDALDAVSRGKDAIVPVCVPGSTAVDYLKTVAVCRMYSKVPHVQTDPDWCGMKVAQLALRFGADDFGNRKPGSQIAEEEIRRVIREAGFVPKRRDPVYRSLAIA